METNIAKYYLELISLDAFEQYIEAKNKDLINYEMTLGENKGFMYVKTLDEGYGIRISYSDDLHEKSVSNLKDIVLNYIKEDKEKTYVLINSKNERFVEFLCSEEFKLVYPSFNMRLKREEVIQKSSKVVLELYNSIHGEAYIELLGEAFVPIRRTLSLEPYNWYGNHISSSLKGFEESAKEGYLYSWFKDDKLIGVLEVIGNELETIAIHPSYQGLGFGGELLNKSIELVFSNEDHDEMILGALQGNSRAQAIYEKYGFKVVANQTILLREKKNT